MPHRKPYRVVWCTRCSLSVMHTCHIFFWLAQTLIEFPEEIVKMKIHYISSDVRSWMHQERSRRC